MDFKNKETIFLYDSTAVANASRIKIDPENLEDDLIIFNYKNGIQKDNPTYLDLLEPFHRKMGFKGHFLQQVLVESLFIDGKGWHLLDRKLVKEEHPERVEFALTFNRGGFSHLSFIEAQKNIHQDFFTAMKGFLNRARGNENKPGAMVVAFTDSFEGRQLGDNAIRKLTSDNLDKNFFVVTSDRELGRYLEDQPNVSPMNIAGLYTSLRDMGVLKKLGFIEELENGTTFDDKLIKLRVVAEGGTLSKSFSYQSTVVRSDDFEEFLLFHGHERIKGKGTTLTTSFEELHERSNPNSILRK